MIQLNPDVLDRAKKITGSRSDEQLGQAFLNRTGSTIRNYRAGKSVPDIVTLLKLKEITGTALDQMFFNEENGKTAA